MCVEKSKMDNVISARTEQSLVVHVEDDIEGVYDSYAWMGRQMYLLGSVARSVMATPFVGHWKAF